MKKVMKKVFICSPYRGDCGENDAEIERNVENALRYCRAAVDGGYFPHCPHVYFTRFINDADATEREAAISMGLAWFADCSEIWVIGDRVSDGMTREVAAAKERNIDIRYFDANMGEEFRLENANPTKKQETKNQKNEQEDISC